MGIEVRRIDDKQTCRCFLFPAGKDKHPESLCFTKGVIGALDEGQRVNYCTPISFKPENQGGIAIDLAHPDPGERAKVENLMRTMKQFSEGVEEAKQQYRMVPRAERRRDLEDWRQEYVAPNLVNAARGKVKLTEVQVNAIGEAEAKTVKPKVYRGPRKPRAKRQKMLERKAQPKSVLDAKVAFAKALGHDELAKRLKEQG